MLQGKRAVAGGSVERLPVHDDIQRFVYARGKGAGKPGDVGQVLYNRGMLNAMLAVESVRTAQAQYGARPLTGEQVRWGLEHLNLDAKRIAALGIAGMLQPLATSCSDHEGTHSYRVHTWDGKQWNYSSPWYTSDASWLRPMQTAAATKYAAEKQIVRRICAAQS